MGGGKQHARHGQDSFDALGLERIEAVANDRPGEFEIPAFDGILRQTRLYPFGDKAKLSQRIDIPAAMATDHDPDAVAIGGRCVARRAFGDIECHGILIPAASFNKLKRWKQLTRRGEDRHCSGR